MENTNIDLASLSQHFTEEEIASVLPKDEAENAEVVEEQAEQQEVEQTEEPSQPDSDIVQEEKPQKLKPTVIAYDRFKEVNDSLGHAAGDELLVQGAARLQGCVGDRGLIGRMGGDEFAVLLIEQAEGDVLRTAECILEAIRAPFPLQEGEARISSSVGVAFHSLEAATPARLLKNADVAMYRAKGEGRDRLWRYRPSTFTDSGYGRVF